MKIKSLLISLAIVGMFAVGKSFAAGEAFVLVSSTTLGVTSITAPAKHSVSSILVMNLDGPGGDSAVFAIDGSTFTVLGGKDVLIPIFPFVKPTTTVDVLTVPGGGVQVLFFTGKTN